MEKENLINGVYAVDNATVADFTELKLDCNVKNLLMRFVAES